MQPLSVEKSDMIDLLAISKKKEAYTAPTCMLFGDVHVITRAIGNNGDNDMGSGGNNKTG